MITAQNLICVLSDSRIHVYGIDRLHIWMLVHHMANGPEHILHELTQLLTATSSNYLSFLQILWISFLHLQHICKHLSCHAYIFFLP